MVKLDVDNGCYQLRPAYALLPRQAAPKSKSRIGWPPLVPSLTIPVWSALRVRSPKLRSRGLEPRFTARLTLEMPCESSKPEGSRSTCPDSKS